jgi:hypothetical protein
MYNEYFITDREGNSYSKRHYRLEGNMLQVKSTILIGAGSELRPITIWKDLRELSI